VQQYHGHEVECHTVVHSTRTNKMHNTVPRYFVLQYHFEHSYMFRALREHHGGVKSICCSDCCELVIDSARNEQCKVHIVVSLLQRENLL
jgi:hypothetical protein